jgi:hypothetical protein
MKLLGHEFPRESAVNGVVSNVSMGPLPTCTNNSCSDVSSQQLKGTLPSFLIELQDLVSLDVHDNQLRGPIPFWYGKEWKLLDVSGNQFSGSIPGIGVQRGGRIALQGNLLEGYIPLEMSTLEQPDCPFDSHLCALSVPPPCQNVTFTCHSAGQVPGPPKGNPVMIIAAVFPCLLVLMGILGTAYALFWRKRKRRRVVPMKSFTDQVLSMDQSTSVSFPELPPSSPPSPPSPTSPTSTASPHLHRIPSSTTIQSTKWYNVKLEMGLDDVVQGLEAMKRQQERYRVDPMVEQAPVGEGYTAMTSRIPMEQRRGISIPCWVQVPTVIKTPSLEKMLMYRPGIPPPPVFLTQASLVVQGGPPTCPLPTPPTKKDNTM